MYNLYMTAYSGKILGPIAKVFGIIINAIYNFFESTLGIENVNIAFIIVIFTIVIYTLLLPLTYQQQKFTVLQRKISPELQAINNKYKGKKDQASMLKRQEETQALYDKYGISMSGNCVQLFIQMPILYALYRVFMHLPAYIDSVRSIFDELVLKIQATSGYQEKMQKLYENLGSRRIGAKIDFLDKTASAKDLGNNIVDIVYILSEDGWNSLSKTFPSLTDTITATHNSLKEINYLFVLNISDNPLSIIKSAFEAKQYLLIFAALLIPLFSYLSQSLNLRIAQANSPKSSSDPMAQQMQTMNKIMPLISLFFVFSVPIGLGIYWIAGALYRSASMLVLNKHFEKMDINAIVEKNKEKAAKKRAKRQARNESITAAATINTRKTTMAEKANIGNSEAGSDTNDERSYKADSLTGKANLVAKFNKKNNTRR